MVGRGNFYELLDFTKFANPSVLRIDSVQTAYNLAERIGGIGFMSYGMIWSRLEPIVNGLATDAFIKSEFSPYNKDYKNLAIQDVAQLLLKYFGGKGRWYKLSQKPTKVLGFWFKPSIRGVWWVNGRAYAVLINARKNQPLHRDHVGFLARGIYELHCVPDPNDPIPLIIDVSEPERGKGRVVRAYEMPVEKAISLEEFEASVRQFLKALGLAGIAQPSDGADILTLFRK